MQDVLDSLELSPVVSEAVVIRGSVALTSPTKVEAAPTTGRPLRILLAEDNLVNQRVALGFLAKYGYRADVAGNGIEVLDALKRQSYDLIMMDVNMLEMDGLVATEAIRSRKGVAAQPYIIAMTANGLSRNSRGSVSHTRVTE